MKIIKVLFSAFFIVLTLTLGSIVFAANKKCPLTPGGAYKVVKNSTVYYITPSCTKQAFADPRIFFQYFSSWGKVKTATKKIMNKVPADKVPILYFKEEPKTPSVEKKEKIKDISLPIKKTVEVTEAANECRTLQQSGDPKKKINIVFIPDGGISFEDYKNYVESFFKQEYAHPNFKNRQPFSGTERQFNFYSIWKEENFRCHQGEFDCELKTRELAKKCPITSGFDGITVVAPFFAGERNDSAGVAGSIDVGCRVSDTKRLVNYRGSDGKIYALNICPGWTTVHLSPVGERGTTLLHEWGHMVGALPHSGERRTIMSEFLPRSDSFDVAEVQSYCQRISLGSDMKYETCLIQSL